MTDKDIRHGGETYEDYNYMLLKTEKLSVAVHILTGHLSIQEPLREDLRRAALRLVKDMRVLVSGEKGSIISDTTHLKIGSEAIISGLYVAKSAKMISAGNAEILEREYLELGNYFSRSQIENLKKEIPVNQIEKSNTSAEARTPSSIRQNVINIRQIKSERPEKGSSFSNQQDGVTRRELILNILEGKNLYSLGDIVTRLKGGMPSGRQVSEKTIQRDLLGLVADKVLKKTGERRWSRYARA